MGAVLAQRPAPLEIVLLDSGSTDGMSESLAGPGVRLVRYTAPFTHAGSSNAAAREARGEVLLFLSQDALPVRNDCLRYLVEALRADGVAAAFARQSPPAGTPVLEAHDILRAYPEKGASPVALSNVCSAIRRELWQRHPFEERLPLAEDLEWALWAAGQGLDVRYEPRAVVEHAHAYDAHALKRRYLAEGRALAMLGRRPFSRGSPWMAWLSGLPGDLARVLASGRVAEIPSACLYHLRQYRALADGASLEPGRQS